MDILTTERVRKKRAVSAVLATIMVFSMVLTVAVGAFVFLNQGVLGTYQAQQQNNQAFNQASQEKLSIAVTNFSPTYLGLRINNTGAVSVSLVDIFVTNPTSNMIVSKSGVNLGSQLSQAGDLNYSLPITILQGISTNQMAGCGPTVGCDIGVKKSTYGSLTQLVVSVVTSSGNIFSSAFPPPPTGSVTTITTSTSTASTMTLSTTNPGGNALVVQMSATPPQTFTCGHCVNDTVTVYNYGSSNVTNIQLSPSPPQANPTGKITVTPVRSCILQGGSPYLPGYPGVGAPPSITYLCTYSVSINGFGGFVSFVGSATGTYLGQGVTSGVAISNTIQVGGPLNVLNQGPFSADYFFFKVSYCYQKAGSFFDATAGCRGLTPNPLNVANLPNADLQNASSDYYDAYYINVTNNFNTALPLLHTSFFQTDPTRGGESDFYLVGVNNSAYRLNHAYFPAYNTGGSGDPTLTAYPTDCNKVNGNNVPYDHNCIYLKPGQTVVLTFAACAAGASAWDWGGIAYGRSFDNPPTCFPQSPPDYFTPESTYLSIVLSFAYDGQVLNQQIPFEGETVTGGTNNGGLACNGGKYCGQVYFTEYATNGCQGHNCQNSGGYGAVGYFDFTYNSVTQTLNIQTPVFVVAPNPGLPHGSDGIAFNPQDHMIMVGANDGTNYVQEVNPNNGMVTLYLSTVRPYNLHVQTDGTKVWMDPDGLSGLASMTLTPNPGGATILPLTGDDTQVNALMFVPGDSVHAFYTRELGSRFAGVTGHVGIINLQTGVTTCFKDSTGSCIVFQGVHGGVYDPYTGDLIVFGSNMINQITTSGVLVSHEVVGTVDGTNLATNEFDQGAVDGFGHLFIAWNGGGVYFEDYATSGKIGSGNFNGFSTGGGLLHYLDDLAPIIGPGSTA